jgi:hypothetical protein
MIIWGVDDVCDLDGGNGFIRIYMLSPNSSRHIH